jgi:uncharacterized protein involved in exopolysaccharide biosynthesis
MVTGADSELPVEGSGEEGEFGLAQAKLLGAFFLRAPRRHPRLAAVILVLTVALGVAAALFLPRSYDCDVRILAQHQLVLPALDNPGRAVPREADAPTKNAADAILQHDNLVTMIKELDLIARWQATREPALRLKDTILSFGASNNKRSEIEQIRDMIELLQKRLSVVADESSITIAVTWPDKQVGFEIVSFLQKNFLEARYDSNVNVIVEAIHILEERAKPQAAEVDAALADLTKVENERRQAFVGSASPAAAAGPRGGRWARAAAGAGASALQATGGAGPNADIARQLEDVRSRIRSITQERDRQLMEAHQQLADARATLGPMHPTVVALNDKIAALEVPPSELQGLEQREHQLVAALAAPGPSPAVPAASTPAPLPSPLPPVAVATAAPVGVATASASSTAPTIAELLREDPEIALASSRLQAASSKYNELLSRIEAANIELEVTRAGFKYQYTVVRPPEIPRKPSKPNVTLIMIATLLAAPLLAMLLAGVRDLLRGRFVEPWQVERHLNLPLLGELNLPP